MHIWMNACNAYMHATTKHEQNEKKIRRKTRKIVQKIKQQTQKEIRKNKRKQQHNNTSGVQGQHTYKRATHSYSHRFL